MEWLKLIPIACCSIAVIGMIGLMILDWRFKKRVKNLKYPISSMDHAVEVGLLDCEQCRNKKACHEIYPQVFPDIEKKCTANFTFGGTYYHYKVEDINEKI